MRPALTVILLSALFATGVPAAGQSDKAKKPFAIEDLYLWDAPQAVALSPDGKRLAYVRHWIDGRHPRYALWLADGSRDKVRPLEKDQSDARAPVFSPDGKWLAFLSTRSRPAGWKPTLPVPPESEPATDVWLIAADGGKAVPLAGPDKPYGRVFNDGFYGRLAFSPDGKRLAFVADDGVDPRTPEEISNDVQIVRPDQGDNYTGYGTAQVWVADLELGTERHAARKVERLTNDDTWYGDPQWAPDGKTLVVHANRTSDREAVRGTINKNFDLWAIDVRSHALRRLTDGPGPEVSPRFSPDGKRIVCLSVPRKGSHRDAFNFVIVTLAEGGPRSEVLFDHHSVNGDPPPHPSPSFPLPQECWHGDTLVYNASVGVDNVTVRMALATKKGAIVELKDEKPDAVTPVGRLAQRRQLTPAGNLYTKDRIQAEMRLVRWENDGQKLEGLLTVPPESVAKAPYKLLLHPHGGPHSRSTQGFHFPVQVFAAQGYAVFEPNFRGSDGYGQKFVDADRGDLGGGDVRDILSGIEYLAKEKLIDPERQFVYGTSYGGYLTCWLVGHTTQFRAAAAQNAVTELNVMWGLSDLQSWTEWEFGGRPWEVPAAMRVHSPLTYVDKVKTPTLILHCRDDRRCPIAMGRMYYQALLARKVPTQMVIYPHENHSIKQPRHQEDVLRRTLRWFEEHDKK